MEKKDEFNEETRNGFAAMNGIKTLLIELLPFILPSFSLFLSPPSSLFLRMLVFGHLFVFAFKFVLFIKVGFLHGGADLSFLGK